MGYKQKIVKDYFEINIDSTNNGKNFYMEVCTNKQPYASASKIVHYPNALERLFGVTVSSKLEKAKNELFRKVRQDLEGADARVIEAINDFVKKNQR